MNALVRASLDAELALVTRLVDVPTGSLGYGSDLSCSDDLDPGVELDGVADAPVLLAQALVRRLDCPRGRLPDDADYGIDLAAYLHRGLTVTEQRGMAGAIESELRKDDRVSLARVTVTPSAEGSRIEIAIQVDPVSPSLGGFRLTLALSDAGLLLKELSR